MLTAPCKVQVSRQGHSKRRQRDIRLGVLVLEASLATMMLGNRLPTMRLVLTTCADQASADQLARHLLEQRLAACVSLLPVTSLYHWQGELQREQEVQLVVKTSADQLPRLLEALTRHHSYEVPELVVLEANAAGSYGTWLRNAGGAPC